LQPGSIKAYVRWKLSIRSIHCIHRLLVAHYERYQIIRNYIENNIAIPRDLYSEFVRNVKDIKYRAVTVSDFRYWGRWSNVIFKKTVRIINMLKIGEN
jgi:hypothetical protein